jgi:uncharacterized membrane protein
MVAVQAMTEAVAERMGAIEKRLRARLLPASGARALHGRDHINTPQTIGDAVADAVVAGMGSWRFIIIQTMIVTLWIVSNVIGWRLHWDVYPFILLNLVFSTQAAYASPLILMAANRSSAKDRMRDDHEAVEVDQLFQINQQQLLILQQQSAILEALHALSPTPTQN